MSRLPTPLKLFLNYDDYDHDPNTISATALMKPTQMLILGNRLGVDPNIEVTEPTDEELLSRHASAVGTALHTRLQTVVEEDGLPERLMAVGIPKGVATHTTVNPEEDHELAIYSEIRRTKEIDGVTIGGKPDLIWYGQLQDMKNVGSYTYCKNDPYPYTFQGSIYRWLFQEEIKEDTVEILYNITDWKALEAYKDNYPSSKMFSQKYPLWSVKETEKVIKSKLTEIDKHIDTPAEELPECTDYDLWASPPVHKYFSDINKTDGRCTKRFDDLALAHSHRASKGKGVVITTPSEVKRCNYCDVAEVCEQRKRLISSGRLKEK